jgi:hypothetical protein
MIQMSLQGRRKGIEQTLITPIQRRGNRGTSEELEAWRGHVDAL